MLTPDQKRQAVAAYTPDATIGGIARRIGATFEEVAVFLFGGSADYTPPSPKRKRARELAAQDRREARGEQPDPTEDDDDEPRTAEEPAPEPPAAPARQAAELAQPDDDADEQGVALGPADAGEVGEASHADLRFERLREPLAEEAQPVPEAEASQVAGAAGGGDERLDPNRDFYLTRGDGYYLHQSCSSLTTSRAYAWKGRPRHIKAVLAAMPKWRELTPEPVT